MFIFTKFYNSKGMTRKLMQIGIIGVITTSHINGILSISGLTNGTEPIFP